MGHKISLYQKNVAAHRHNILSRGYETLPLSVLAAQAGCNPNALRCWALKHGYKRTSGYTPQDLADAIGCAGGTVRHWIRASKLRATSRTGKDVGRNKRYTIREQNIITFLRKYPQLWRKYSVPLVVWQQVNEKYAPGSPEWTTALSKFPPPGKCWLDSFL